MCQRERERVRVRLSKEVIDTIRFLCLRFRFLLSVMDHTRQCTKPFSTKANQWQP